MGVAQEVLSSLLLFALVFGMSATVDMEHLKKQLSNRNAILTGVFLQFVVLPFLGFAVVRAANLSAPMGIALLVVTSSPGGSYSNWWCSLFNADLALSVTMTAVSTTVSLLMLPVNLIIYATSTYSGAVVKSLDWSALFVSLVVVIGAIGSGLLCSARVNSHKFNRVANRLGNLAGIALITFSVVVSSSDKQAEIWDRDWTFYLAVATPCCLGLVVANSLTSCCFKFVPPERVTVSVECCFQNTGIATSVAMTMFDGDDLAEAIGVPLFYGIVEAVAIGSYCVGAWKFGWTKAPRDENICVVIATSYEVQEAEIHDPDAIEVVLGFDKDGVPSDLIFQFDGSEGYAVDERSLELSEDRSGHAGVAAVEEESPFGNEDGGIIGDGGGATSGPGGACDNDGRDGAPRKPAHGSALVDGGRAAEGSSMPLPPPAKFRSYSFDSASPRPDEGGGHVRVPVSSNGEPSAPRGGIRSAASFEDGPATPPGRRSRLGLPGRARRRRLAYHKASTSDDDGGDEPREDFEEGFDATTSNAAGARRRGKQYEKLPIPCDKGDVGSSPKVAPEAEAKDSILLPAEEHTID